MTYLWINPITGETRQPTPAETAEIARIDAEQAAEDPEGLLSVDPATRPWGWIGTRDDFLAIPTRLLAS